MSDFNTTLSYRESSSYTDDNSGNASEFNTGSGTLQSHARKKHPSLLQGSEERSGATSVDGAPESIERIAYRATSNYFARAFNLPKDKDGKVSVDKDNVLRHFDWKNERVVDSTVDSIFDDVISQVAAERSRRGQSSRGNVKAHADLTASKFSASKGDYNSRLDQMIQSIGGPELLEALRKASELITSQMDEDEEDSDSDISSPNMRAPDMPPAPSVPTSARPVIGSAKAAGASQGSSKAGASSGASSASSAEAQAAQEKIAKALESGGDDLVSLSENDELMKHASEEQKSEMIAKLQEHSDKKGKCDSRPEGNKADRAIANVMQSANDKSEFDNLMKAHGGQELLHSVEYGEAKQSLVQAAAAWGSNEFIDEKHQEKYSKEIAASQDLFLNPPDKSSKIQPPAVGSYGSDPTATGLERVESETNAYIADQAYTNLSPRAQREMLLMNAQRASEGKEAVDNTEVISEVERLRSRTLAQIEAGDEDSYKEQWEAWKQGLERIRKEHDMSEDAFRHTVTSRYENFYLGTNVSFGEPDSGEKDERSNEEKYHSYTRDEADLEQLREKYGQAPASAINGLDASSSLGATGVAGQAAQEELHKLLQEYEQAVAEEGFESRRAETLRQEIADLEESSSEYTADLNKIGVELDTLYQPPPADTFWLKFTEVFLAVAELAMTLAAAAFLGPAGVALISAGWAIYHATQKDWMAMAGSLAGGAVGGMGAASGAIAKSAAKGSQTGATLARGIGSKAATSTTKAAATTGAKSASSFSQNVSNLVAKTGKAGQFMGLNPSDDVLITTGKLTNMSQTTFETSYAASQGDALGAASSSLGLSQEGMNARRLTRLTQNSATAAVTTTYTVQAGQKFADGNYEGTFDLIGGVSNVGNLSGSNEHFKAGIGGVNEGLPTVDYSRSGKPDAAATNDPEKQPLLGDSEEDTETVDAAEETERTEETKRLEAEKRYIGRSSQVKVEQMLEDTLGVDVAKNIDAYYDPTMPEGQVRYTPDRDEQRKLQLSYGPNSNEQNIQWHVEHLDALLQYNDNERIEGIVEKGKEVIPELSSPGAIIQLEFDKHEKLIKKAKTVIDDKTGLYHPVDKAMAQENLLIYEQEQADLILRISNEKPLQQVNKEGKRYVAAGAEHLSNNELIASSSVPDGVDSLESENSFVRSMSAEQIEQMLENTALGQELKGNVLKLLSNEQVSAFLTGSYSDKYKRFIIKNLEPDQVNGHLIRRNPRGHNSMYLIRNLEPNQINDYLSGDYFSANKKLIIQELTPEQVIDTGDKYPQQQRFIYDNLSENQKTELERKLNLGTSNDLSDDSLSLPLPPEGSGVIQERRTASLLSDGTLRSGSSLPSSPQNSEPVIGQDNAQVTAEQIIALSPEEFHDFVRSHPEQKDFAMQNATNPQRDYLLMFEYSDSNESGNNRRLLTAEQIEYPDQRDFLEDDVPMIKDLPDDKLLKILNRYPEQRDFIIGNTSQRQREVISHFEALFRDEPEIGQDDAEIPAEQGQGLLSEDGQLQVENIQSLDADEVIKLVAAQNNEETQIGIIRNLAPHQVVDLLNSAAGKPETERQTAQIGIIQNLAPHQVVDLLNSAAGEAENRQDIIQKLTLEQVILLLGEQNNEEAQIGIIQELAQRQVVDLLNHVADDSEAQIAMIQSLVPHQVVDLFNHVADEPEVQIGIIQKLAPHQVANLLDGNPGEAEIYNRLTPAQKDDLRAFGISSQNQRNVSSNDDPFLNESVSNQEQDNTQIPGERGQSFLSEDQELQVENIQDLSPNDINAILSSGQRQERKRFLIENLTREQENAFLSEYPAFAAFVERNRRLTSAEIRDKSSDAELQSLFNRFYGIQDEGYRKDFIKSLNSDALVFFLSSEAEQNNMQYVVQDLSLQQVLELKLMHESAYESVKRYLTPAQKGHVEHAERSNTETPWEREAREARERRLQQIENVQNLNTDDVIDLIATENDTRVQMDIIQRLTPEQVSDLVNSRNHEPHVQGAIIRKLAPHQVANLLDGNPAQAEIYNRLTPAQKGDLRAFYISHQGQRNVSSNDDPFLNESASNQVQDFNPLPDAPSSSRRVGQLDDSLSLPLPPEGSGVIQERRTASLLSDGTLRSGSSLPSSPQNSEPVIGQDNAQVTAEQIIALSPEEFHDFVRSHPEQKDFAMQNVTNAQRDYLVMFDHLYSNESGNNRRLLTAEQIENLSDDDLLDIFIEYPDQRDFLEDDVPMIKDLRDDKLLEILNRYPEQRDFIIGNTSQRQREVISHFEALFRDEPEIGQDDAEIPAEQGQGLLSEDGQLQVENIQSLDADEVIKLVAAQNNEETQIGIIRNLAPHQVVDLLNSAAGKPETERQTAQIGIIQNLAPHQVVDLLNSAAGEAENRQDIIQKLTLEQVILLLGEQNNEEAQIGIIQELAQRQVVDLLNHVADDSEAQIGIIQNLAPHQVANLLDGNPGEAEIYNRLTPAQKDDLRAFDISSQNQRNVSSNDDPFLNESVSNQEQDNTQIPGERGQSFLSEDQELQVENIQDLSPNDINAILSSGQRQERKRFLIENLTREQENAFLSEYPAFAEFVERNRRLTSAEIRDKSSDAELQSLFNRFYGIQDEGYRKDFIKSLNSDALVFFLSSEAEQNNMQYVVQDLSLQQVLELKLMHQSAYESVKRYLTPAQKGHVEHAERSNTETPWEREAREARERRLQP